MRSYMYTAALLDCVSLYSSSGRRDELGTSVGERLSMRTNLSILLDASVVPYIDKKRDAHREKCGMSHGLHY